MHASNCIVRERSVAPNNTGKLAMAARCSSLLFSVSGGMIVGQFKNRGKEGEEINIKVIEKLRY